MIKFEWGPVKAASNQKKHGVSFEEARSVFYDEFAVCWSFGGFRLSFMLFTVLGSVVMSPFLQFHIGLLSLQPNSSFKRDALRHPLIQTLGLSRNE